MGRKMSIQAVLQKVGFFAPFNRAPQSLVARVSLLVIVQSVDGLETLLAA